MSERRADCARARDLAAEFVLGIAPGDERAFVLEHLTGCEECRRFVHEMSAVADELLLIAPDREPPLGFESAVVKRLAVERGSARKSRGWVAVAAALAALLVGGSAVWFATSEDRKVGSYYRSVLERADGEYFTARELWSDDGERSGVVFAYEGDPSWLFMVVDEEYASGEYTCYAELGDGRSFALGTFSLEGDRRTWGAAIDARVHDLDRIRLQGPDGNLVASFERR
jgi:hypothetical protein